MMMMASPIYLHLFRALIVCLIRFLVVSTFFNDMFTPDFLQHKNDTLTELRVFFSVTRGFQPTQLYLILYIPKDPITLSDDDGGT